MKKVLSKILNISGVIVEEYHQTEETLILSVKVKEKTATCPRCGTKSHRIHQNKKRLGRVTLKLIDWLKKAEPYYKKSVKTIKRWLPEIVGYFESRTTNGVVEGINNKLKLIKRSAFGFRNFDNFEMRALLSWHFPQDLAH